MPSMQWTVTIEGMEIVTEGSMETGKAGSEILQFRQYIWHHGAKTERS